MEKQTNDAVKTIALEIAKTIHGNRKYLPRKFNCAGYVVKSAEHWCSNYSYRIFYNGKRKPFCEIRAYEYYYNGDCFGLKEVYCNDIDLCMLKDLQTRLDVYCNMTVTEYKQKKQEELVAETEYKKALLGI